jgi:RimJ/RimL family protein N-acetyltransferase
MFVGDRVTLRGIRRDDLPRLWEFDNDVAVELAGGGDPPIPQSFERLQAEFDQNAAKGSRDGAQFAIEVDGKFVGQCALFNFDSTAMTCELGITIGDQLYRGRGYGRESIRLLLDYAFRLRNFHKVLLRVHGDNERAMRAYRASGFVEEGRLRAHVFSNGRYADAVYMGVLRDNWSRGRVSNEPTPR